MQWTVSAGLAMVFENGTRITPAEIILALGGWADDRWVIGQCDSKFYFYSKIG
jgi:hypothetical protein